MRTTFFISHREGWYFRIFGYGISCSKSTYIPFSVRNGYVKELRLFGRRWQWLQRKDIT